MIRAVVGLEGALDSPAHRPIYSPQARRERFSPTGTGAWMQPLDIVIPVYNEGVDVVRSTVSAVREALADRQAVSIIVVDDGSAPEFSLDALGDDDGIVLVRHETNRGYGSALKSGIRAGSAPWIAIIDADETYPAESLPELVDAMDGADMVVGVRTGSVREIPWLRRVPKQMLNSLASYMAGVRIRDLNSGMRVFTRNLCYQLWGMLPRGFSFTSTMTMGAHLSGQLVRERPIDYYKRVGSSSIRPIRDTIKFAHIIVRMGLLFHPMKLFMPVAAFLFLGGAAKGILRDIPREQSIGNLAVTLMLAGVQIFLMGYLGELIVGSRMLAYRNPDRGPEDVG